MRVRHLAFASCLAGWALGAPAAEVSGSATTIFRVYDLLNDEDEQGLGTQAVRSWRPLDEILHLSVEDWGGRGAWSFTTDMRGRIDVGGGPGTQSDFQVLLADVGWRSKSGAIEVHLGRLSSTVGLGWHAYDGARVDFDGAEHVRGFAYAGLPQPWGSLKEPGADDGDPATLDADWTLGAGLALVAPRHGTFGLDYEVSRAGSVTVWEVLGADLSFGTGAFRVSANTDYSLVTEEHHDTAVELQGTIDGRHVVTGRYTRVLPIFAIDTIWNVFEVNPYDEVRVSYEHRGRKRLQWGGYVSHESYEETEYDGPQDMRHAAATFTYAAPRHGKFRTELGWQEGWASDRLTLRSDADWDLTPRWRAGAGLSVGRYENAYRLGESDELWSLRARVQHDHAGRWNLAIEVEDYVGEGSNNLRAAMVFGTKFGAARRSRPWWGGRWGDAWGGGSPTRAESADEAAAGGGVQ